MSDQIKMAHSKLVGAVNSGEPIDCENAKAILKAAQDLVEVACGPVLGSRTWASALLRQQLKKVLTEIAATKELQNTTIEQDERAAMLETSKTIIQEAEELAAFFGNVSVEQNLRNLVSHWRIELNNPQLPDQQRVMLSRCVQQVGAFL